MSWATDCHFLLAKISGDRMRVLPIGALDDPAATPVEITRYSPTREPRTGPIEIAAGTE